MHRWREGQGVVLREVWDGRVWTAMPAVVVEDDDDRQLFFIPPGTHMKYAVDEDGRELRLYAGRWALADHVTRRPVLSFSWPDARHAVLLFWDADWRFAGWYVNIESRLRRTPLGLDYVDHCLDVLIPPDRSSWTWKDEEELDEAIAHGVFTAAQGEEFRAEGERAARRIIEGEPPFDRDWSRWRPRPEWPVPTLLPGWDVVGE